MFCSANRSDAKQVLAGLALGFAADPIARWVYPEPDAFLEHFPKVMNFFGGPAFDHGSAHRNEDCTACALWLPPDVHPDVEQLIQCCEDTVAPARLDALLDMFEQMDRFHPDYPCWHLAFIAVDPARQGNGLGSALLKSTLRQCDSDGRAAYLESTNPANMSLYRRFGFAEIGVIQAGGMPPMFPMLRPPA